MSSRSANELSPTMPHLVWSAMTMTRRAARTKARFVSDSARLGVVSPATGSIPWQPRNSRSKCSDRIARSATGPTSASDGVRTPPVRITAGWSGPPPDAGLPSSSRLATRTELVTIVSLGISRRCRASSKVVVPADSAIAVPGLTSAAAARAMASFSGRSSTDLASNPGSWLLGAPGSTAPPCTFSISPARARTSRSRRMVISETPEPLGKIGHAGAARPPDVLQDKRLPVLGEHPSAFRRREQHGWL